MKLYNTLTRQKEAFVPANPSEATVYACGPTVYNLIHIGNARPLCVFDVLRRYMEYRGQKVCFVQNFTDIDDKIIRRAQEENTGYESIAEQYIEEYWTDAKGLNIRPATIHPKATENMQEILSIIETLAKKGFAYAVGGDVYFRTHRFAEYGKLSGQPLEDLEAGARINVSEQKDNPMDFALWKAAKPGEPYWSSPWGNGRPGWHIECSAMARRYLGETIDIHCGGQDLIFPHHENEIAQSECCNGKPFARFWLHNGYINVDNIKMSKSLGNFFTVRDVAQAYGYEPIRFLMISAHYRSPINYSTEMIEQCKSALSRLYHCISELDDYLQNTRVKSGEKDADIASGLLKRREQFVAAMEDDLNTADALSALFELTRDINTELAASTLSEISGTAAKALFEELCEVLGLLYNRKVDTLDSQIEALIAERTLARQNKDYARSDAIRDELKAMGILLKDTPLGVKWYHA